MKTKITKKIAYVLSALAMLLGLAVLSQNRANARQERRENSEQLMQQVTQELKSAREQVSKVDTDKAGHKYKLEQLLDQAEREASDLNATLPHGR